MADLIRSGQGDRAKLPAARVIVTSGTRTQAQTVLSQSSYYSHDDLRLHFGLGASHQAHRITIYWSRGHVETLSEVKANQVLVIRPQRQIVRQIRRAVFSCPSGAVTMLPRVRPLFC